MSRPDKYSNFAELAAAEPSAHYSIEYEIRRPPAAASASRSVAAAEEDSAVTTTKKTSAAAPHVLCFAPHGGKIEMLTTEIARHVASLNGYSYYSFVGRRNNNNRELHITSIRFDEPTFERIVQSVDTTVAIHGTGDEPSQSKILVGGLFHAAKELLVARIFPSRGFTAVLCTEKYTGTQPENVCNRAGRGTYGGGVQLELTLRMREELVQDWEKMRDFAECLRMAMVVAA